MLQFPIMTAQEIALDAAFALLPITVLESCFILFHNTQFRNNQDPSSSQLQSLSKTAQPTKSPHPPNLAGLAILAQLAVKPQKSAWIKTIH